MYRISAIVPSYNGALRIRTILNALANQVRQLDEVIVVIDGSTDNTLEVLNESEHNLNLKIIVQENSGRAATRNKGANAAKGDLLIFYDDDTRPQPNSVKLHENLHRNHQKAVCSGFTLEDANLINCDFSRFRRHLSLKWTDKYTNGINKLDQKSLFLTAANLSIKKKHFHTLGGFNATLTDAEDFELAIRAFQRGMELYFDKSNIAWHDDLISCKEYIIRQKEYLSARLVLDTIIPDFFRRKKLKRGILKSFVFWLFANSFMVNRIDRNHLVFLPRQIRYKIYDIAVTGCSTSATT